MKPVLHARTSLLGQAQSERDAIGRKRAQEERTIATLREEALGLASQAGRQSNDFVGQAKILRRADELEREIKNAKARLARTDEEYAAAVGSYELLFARREKSLAAHDQALADGNEAEAAKALADLDGLTGPAPDAAKLSPKGSTPGVAGRVAENVAEYEEQIRRRMGVR